MLNTEILGYKTALFTAAKTEQLIQCFTKRT